MRWEELQQELEEAFTTEGILGKRILAIAQRELDYKILVESTFRGHQVLSLSFQEFFAETLEISASVWKEDNRKPTPPTFSEIFRWQLANFRNLRASTIIFSNGYPFDGLARLRQLKESALFLGAMLAGLTTYPKINGDDPNDIEKGGTFTREESGKRRTRRKKEESRVLGLMLRKKSGFSVHQLAELETWEGFFHSEVHGTRLTRFIDIRADRPITLAPSFVELSCAMFINRYSEICWMLHRTMPILQLSYRKFGNEWARKWDLLDINFQETEKGLVTLGKPIGRAITDFVTSKFNFSPDYCFDTHVKFP